MQTVYSMLVIDGGDDIPLIHEVTTSLDKLAARVNVALAESGHVFDALYTDQHAAKGLRDLACQVQGITGLTVIVNSHLLD